MTSRSSDKATNRTIVGAFLRAAGIPIQENAVHDADEPSPDILCTFTDGTRVAFELTEAVDQQVAQNVRVSPASREKMREYYETWWSRVEPGLREFQPLSIGSERENPVALSSSDWQEIYCDNVNSVLAGLGGPKGAPWRVLVERDGNYEISLHRWPAEKDLPLNAPCPEKKLTAGSLPAGKAFPIAGAKLTIAGQTLFTKTAARDTAATFRLKLKGGTKTDIHGWFQDAAGNDLCGAYYACVNRL